MFSRQTISIYTWAVATQTSFFFQRRVTLCLSSSK